MRMISKRSLILILKYLGADGMVMPSGGTTGGLVSNPKSEQKLLKKNGIKLVWYAFRLKNHVKIPPPLLLVFAELAPPLVMPYF